MVARIINIKGKPTTIQRLICVITLIFSGFLLQQLNAGEEKPASEFSWKFSTHFPHISGEDKNGVVSVKVNKAGNPGGVRADLSDLKAGQRYEFSCKLISDMENSCWLQLKSYQDKNELPRINTAGNMEKEQTLVLRFTAKDAIKYSIWLRQNASNKYIGCTSNFSEFKLREIAIEDKNENIWGNASGCVFRQQDDSIIQKFDANSKIDAIIRSEINTFNKNTTYEFSYDVQASGKRMAYLQVKLFKDNKELKRVSSNQNKESKERLSVQFNTADADKVFLLCRIVKNLRYADKPATWSNFYFGAPRKAQSGITQEQITEPKFDVVPGFEVCSVYYNKCKANDYNQISATLTFRKKGSDAWLPALTPVFIRHEKSLRASLLQLNENTEYELKLVVTDCGDREEIIQPFKTKSIDVPIAKTIIITKEMFAEGSWIPESGTEQGYIRYIASKGFIAQASKTQEEAILINEAKYIIIEGLTLKGGRRHGISIIDSEHIRIINCDISGYGRAGKFRPDIDGKFFIGETPIWHDAGIQILHSKDILAERNFIHDPDAIGNSWYYSHPAGPTGMYVGDNREVCVRYNDIIGSDSIRWNDGIDGWKNFYHNGGFNRDAEICGNYFAFGDDDGAELDGGQMNVRFFRNKVEGFYCGVSLIPCLRGPSYVYQNEFVNPGDEFLLSGSSIKMFSSTMKVIFGTVSLLENRISWQHGVLFPKMPEQQTPSKLLFSRRNIFDIKEPYRLPKQISYTVDIDDNKSVSELLPDKPGAYPERPSGFTTSKSHLAFTQVNNQPQAESITLTINTPGLKEHFIIVQPRATKHFTVEPSEGVIEFGKPVKITVTTAPQNIKVARRNVGAFSVRVDNGFSRPVSVLADSRQNPELLAAARAQAIFGSVEKQTDGSMIMNFTVNKAGAYYLFVKPTAESSSRALIKLDDNQEHSLSLTMPKYCKKPWRGVYKGLDQFRLELSEGKHTVYVKQDPKYKVPDYIKCALAEDPSIFLFAPDDLDE